MNAAASKIVAEGVLKGFFEIIDTQISGTTTFTIAGVADLSPDAWADYIPRYRGALQASIKGGGVLTLLLPASVVEQFVGLFEAQAQQPKAALAEQDLASMRAVFDACLGGVAAYFKEQFGREVAWAEIKVVPFDMDHAQSVAELLGDDVTEVPFHFALPAGQGGDAVLLFTQNLEGLPPAHALVEAASQPDPDEASQQLTQEELDNILANVAPPRPSDAEEASKQPLAHSRTPPGPPNLDIVLDIELVARARLGRVELPISEVLALGPGSILEVGRMVDEPVELLVNDKLIARGDVVVVEEKFGLRITEIVSPQQRIESLR